MERRKQLTEYFKDVETGEEYNGYFCSVGEALSIIILGSFCGLEHVNKIHQWAKNSRVREFLMRQFGIGNIPCYYWLTCLLKLIKPESLNQCFIKCVQSLLPENMKGQTLSFDGKTIRSTGKMEKYESAMHIASAHIAELGITFATMFKGIK